MVKQKRAAKKKKRREKLAEEGGAAYKFTGQERDRLQWPPRAGSVNTENA